MIRRSWLAGIALMASTMANCGEPSLDLSTIDRTIIKEPDYESVPRYALLVIGPRAEHRAWIVIDGDEVAYVDRNGNGDLTEPDEHIDLDQVATDKLMLKSSGAYKAMHVFKLGNVAGTTLEFRLWVPKPDYDVSKDESYRDRPDVQAFVQDMQMRDWLNGSLFYIDAHSMPIQIPLALTKMPDDAQICNILGPMTLQLNRGTRQRLEPWPKRTQFEVNIGSRNLPPQGWSHVGFDFSALATSEVPEYLHPVATINYPVAEAINKPLQEEITLDQRCCGSTFYSMLTLPKGLTSGTAEITVSIPPWPGHSVESAQFKVPINEAWSTSGEVAYVMFNDSNIELKDAVSVLRKRKLDVVIRKDSGTIMVVNQGEQEIGIRLNRDPEVQNVARGSAEGTEVVEELGRCNARFEISHHETDNVEVFRRIEQWLQELTGGFLYQTWDKLLSGPS